jgi:hypothetical protein
MTVRHFYIVGIVIAPGEANPILIVDPNAVLSSTVVAQFLQPVTRGTLQITQLYCHIEHSEFSFCYIRRRSTSGLAGSPDFLGRPIRETADHVLNSNEYR